MPPAQEAAAAAVVVEVVAEAAVAADVEVAVVVETKYLQSSHATESGAATKCGAASKIGIGFRPELATFIAGRDIEFVEIVADDYLHLKCIPQALRDLQRRGVTIIPHSLSLSIGGADEIDIRRVKHLNSLAQYFDSPYVSDHIAFVRAGGLESGHLLPVQRNEATLKLICENIAVVKEHLSVPFVLENIASLFEWPANEITEAGFVREILERTDCGLLLDLSNFFANSHNLGFDALQYLKQLPLERLKYVHMAGGLFKNKLYHDSHCHPLKPQSISLLTALKSLCAVPRVMLERDDYFPEDAEVIAELEAIANA